MPDLEIVLREHLSPVRAPRELWERVQTPRQPRRVRVPERLIWAAAAVLLIGSALGWHAQSESRIARPTPSAPFQAGIKWSAGLDLHGACHLCHVD
jgi:hypothetical protein